jgi:HEPN domain-containing protein
MIRWKIKFCRETFFYSSKELIIVMKKHDSVILDNSKKRQAARDFLEVSNQDLKSADILYAQKKFPQAIFYFQQSVEKGYKAYHLSISEKIAVKSHKGKNSIDFNGIIHKPTKITKNMIADSLTRLRITKDTIDSSPNKEKIYSKIQIDYPSLINQMEAAQNFYSINSFEDSYKPQKNSRELDIQIYQLKEAIHQMNRFNRKVKKQLFTDDIISEMKAESIELMQVLVDSFNQSFQNQLDDWGKNFDTETLKNEKIMKFWIIHHVDSSCINTIYSNLSRISENYAVCSRYPDINFSPIRFFTNRLPIVKRLTPLISIAKVANKKMNFYLNPSEKLKNEFPEIFQNIST